MAPLENGGPGVSHGQTLKLPPTRSGNFRGELEGGVPAKPHGTSWGSSPLIENGGPGVFPGQTCSIDSIQKPHGEATSRAQGLQGAARPLEKQGITYDSRGAVQGAARPLICKACMHHV